MNSNRPDNILITGATDGIGRLLADHYLAQGANVAVTGRREPQAVQNMFHNKILYIQADQSNPQSAADTIHRGLVEDGWECCDLAILNAGNGHTCDPLQEKPGALRDTLNVNLVAPVLIARALAPLLVKAPQGKLTIIGSTSHKGAAKFASYAASKAGLHGFARSLREEWRGKINVQIIHPGPTATNMHAKAGFEAGAMKHIFLDPDIVARIIMSKISKGRSPVSAGFIARLVYALDVRRRAISTGDT